jgi:AcrR family transcriptional regulator
MSRRLPRTLPKPPKTEPATNARERLGHQTRERLLEVAARLMLRGSVSVMSISELVQEAVVPASSIYWHFRSKEGLVAAVAAAAVERWLALLPDPDSLPATGEARVMAGIAGITAALVTDGRTVTLVIKVGVELGQARHSALEIVRRARADVIRYGVRVFAPAFDGLTERAARSAAERMSALLMATADGIAVNAAVEGRGAAAPEEYGVLGELAVLLYRQLSADTVSPRGPSRKRSGKEASDRAG